MWEEPEARMSERRKATAEWWRMELEPKRELVSWWWEREPETVEEMRLVEEKMSEMETWLVMRMVRILDPEREPRWLAR